LTGCIPLIIKKYKRIVIMINTFEIFQNLKETFGEKEATVLTNLLIKMYNDINQTVTKAEFQELRVVVGELAEAQKRTEERVEELAQAQKRTEERVEELAQAQKRTEERVEELAQAQKRTEERVEELAQAQKRTEESIKELTRAQRENEKILKNFMVAFDDLKKQVGGLSMVVGYGIEDDLMPLMPQFVQNTYKVKSCEVERKYILYDNGSYDEVNLHIRAKRNGKDIYIIGECKAQPGKKDIDRFGKMLKRIRNHYKSDIYGFIVGYTYHPEIEEYCKKHAIDIFKTYEIKRLAEVKKRNKKQ
jgi:hypothetical protein